MAAHTGGSHAQSQCVVVRSKQPFVDWLMSVEELDVPEITLAQLDKTLYLVPDYEDPEDAEKVLKRVYDDISAGN